MEKDIFEIEVKNKLWEILFLISSKKLENAKNKIESLKKFLEFQNQKIWEKDISLDAKISDCYKKRKIFEEIVDPEVLIFEVENAKKPFWKFWGKDNSTLKIQNLNGIEDVANFKKLFNKDKFKSGYFIFTPKKALIEKAKSLKIEKLNSQLGELEELNIDLLDFEKLIQKIYLEKNKSLGVKVLLLMMCTGRRPIEILNSDTKWGKSENKLKIIGLAKKRGEDVSIEIPTFLESEKILEIRKEILEKLQGSGSAVSQETNKLFKNSLVKFFSKKFQKAYDLRAIFCIFAFEKWGKRTEDKVFFFKKILGHDFDDFQTLHHYNKFIIPEKSKIKIPNSEIFEIIEKKDVKNMFASRIELEEFLKTPLINEIDKRITKTLLNTKKESWILNSRGLSREIRKQVKEEFGAEPDPVRIQKFWSSFFKFNKNQISS